MPKSNQEFGSPYANPWIPTSEHYHAVCSLNENGPIDHARALAHQLLVHGRAANEWEALAMATAQVQSVRQIVDGERLHRAARRQLEAERAAARKRHAPGVPAALSSVT
ncbi:hypothetical protein [Paraburkholderia humisilvae]|uniref:Uncharacterized protein n=1 Tax=Paraburkholderia humisilvae TaxID=627669 RepID=A0A6J5CYB8_9BURK|nr:hypothetical protein [Paraburkholderia humisilvae]CAB3745845.1 hypothetical protein LMG29542_00058 [Paraburkholderia humisilvae]